MKLIGVVGVLLVGLVAAKELEGSESNSAKGAQAVVEQLLAQGLNPKNAVEVKELLEQHDDPYLDCGCPRGFSLFIDSTTGAASCRQVCFRNNISCVTTPVTPNVFGTCAGFEIIPKVGCKLGSLIAGCVCQSGGSSCGSFLFFGGNYLCVAPGTTVAPVVPIVPDVKAPGCPDRTNAFCWLVTTNTCAALTTDQQAALFRVPCVSCDVEIPITPPCVNPCRERDPCRFRRDPLNRRQCNNSNWDGFCDRDDCRTCCDGRRGRDRDLARKAQH